MQDSYNKLCIVPFVSPPGRLIGLRLRPPKLSKFLWATQV
jgi:hypothetical protein